MKYKEFWIYRVKKSGGIIEVRTHIPSPIKYDTSLDEEIHVIEYQAYEKLQKQNEKLKSTLKIYAAEGLYDCVAGQKMTEENNKLVYKLGETAREVLKEIEGKT